jgi:multidrug efflux pump subunit AcrA (membrane-fusion protein)
VVLNQATLANAEAQAAKSVADLKRVDSLAADGSLSLREQDSSKAAGADGGCGGAGAGQPGNRETAGAVGGGEQAVAGSGGGVAEAALKAAKVDLDNTRIVAPEDGQLGQVTVRKGAYVNTGAQLMGLVPKQLWVIANLKETQMNNVQVGQPATFKVDALDGAQLTGVVERISPATGSEFSVLPADNATGNYVKIAQRIPVRIRIDPGQAKARRLAPGMSVIVSIDTSVVREAMSRSPPRASASVAVVLALAGCAASVPPPASSLQPPAAWRSAVEGQGSGPVAREWWQGFGDPALTALVAGRWKTTATCASLARAWRSTGTGRRHGGGTESQRHRRQRADAHAPAGLQRRALRDQRLPGRIPASYEVDVWGRLAALTDAATATYQSEQANADAAALSIAATVASGYLNLRGLDAQLALTEATLKLREQSRGWRRSSLMSATARGWNGCRRKPNTRPPPSRCRS